MRAMKFGDYLKSRFGVNEPIRIEDIKYENYSRQWIFAELKKLVDSGDLKRFERGIYYFPQMMPWGEATLDPYKIIFPRYITDGKEVYGYITGLSLWNMSGISLQVPNLLEIATNNEKTRVRDVYVGRQLVRARRGRTKITGKNEKTMQFLDLMTMIKSPAEMDERERFMLKKFIEKSIQTGVTKESISQYVTFFPATTAKNMVESGVIYDFA
jgi:hypothetical protein